MSRYLVIGSGSIARRHIANLRALDPTAEVACVASTNRTITCDETGAHTVFANLDEAVRWKPTFGIVASPAPLHLSQALTMLSGGIPVLIEKPLTNSGEELRRLIDELMPHADKVDVGYNLRFLPSAIRLKALLDSRLIGRLYNVIVDIGQYLPDWRPGSDYRHNVSARRELGGGVLLELSHEFDYLLWLFGRFDSVYCVAESTGALEIDVEDRVDALLRQDGGLTASVHMDFLQRAATRTCKIIGETGTLSWDLIANRIILTAADGVSEVLFDEPDYPRNDMYLSELARFARVAAGQEKPLVGLQGGAEVMCLIETLRRSAKTGKPVQVECFER